jgi:DNA-binding NarL/FixJ family response regulator
VAAALRAHGDIHVVGTCADGEDACRVAAQLRPDVVLMDLAMPRMDGVEATRCILAIDPDTRIVVFTSGLHGPRIQAALDAGARSCVFKGADTSQLAGALRAAAR